MGTSDRAELTADSSCAVVVEGALTAARRRLAASSGMGVPPPGAPRRREMPRPWFFEFEVTRAAVPSTRPSRVPDGEPAAYQPMVQFIVDARGAVEPPTTKLLSAPRAGRGAADSLAAAAALQRWRYRPATVQGCPVRQLVQTRIRLD